MINLGPYFCMEESGRNEQQTYYIARRPSAFREIVMFLEVGNLQRPMDLSIDMWLDEIVFYKITDIDSAIHARQSLMMASNAPGFEEEELAVTLTAAAKGKRGSISSTTSCSGSDGSGGDSGKDAAGNANVSGQAAIGSSSCWSSWFCIKVKRFQQAIWEITDGALPEDEDPGPPYSMRSGQGLDDADKIGHYPMVSRIYIAFSMMILLAAVVLLIVETLPEFRIGSEWMCVLPNGTFAAEGFQCYPQPASAASGIEPEPGHRQVNTGGGGGIEDGRSGGGVGAGESSGAPPQESFPSFAAGELDANGCSCRYFDVEIEVTAIYNAEMAFVIWFTLEYLVRLFAAPKKNVFLYVYVAFC